MFGILSAGSMKFTVDFVIIESVFAALSRLEGRYSFQHIFPSRGRKMLHIKPSSYKKKLPFVLSGTEGLIIKTISLIYFRNILWWSLWSFIFSCSWSKLLPLKLHFPSNVALSTSTLGSVLLLFTIICVVVRLKKTFQFLEPFLIFPADFSA